jgi:3-hydroxyacyl-CoA dehydrogenase
VASAYYRAAVDEAGRCRAEGIAAEADIDLAMQLGCGWSEGPLTWARTEHGKG